MRKINKSPKPQQLQQLPKTKLKRTWSIPHTTQQTRQTMDLGLSLEFCINESNKSHLKDFVNSVVPTRVSDVCN
ncbi:1966_t:CDS:1, partial [Gigaspora rosea]